MKKNIFKSTKFRFGIHSAVLSVLFVVVIIMLNVITALVSDRFPSINVDLNENKMFTISSQTKGVLNNLNKDVKVMVVSSDNTPRNEYKEFLSRYEEISDKISVEYVNMKKNPGAVNAYSDDIDPRGTFLVICGDRHEAIDAAFIDGSYGRLTDAESYLTNAIVSVSSEDKKYVWFTTGHGEGDFSGLKQIFEYKYFDVADVDLKLVSEQPCDMIVIAAPSQDFAQQELAKLDELSKNGVSLFVLLNNEAQYLPNLSEYISEWGIQVVDEIVYETNEGALLAVYSSLVPVINDTKYSKHINSSYPFLCEFPYRLDVQYSGTKSTEITEILTSTESAVTLKDNQPKTSGKFVLVAVSERIWEDNTRGHMFISGSPLWLSYPYKNISGLPANKQLANTVISEFSGSEEFVEIAAKNTTLKPFIITQSQFVYIAVIISLLAASLIIFGFIVWRIRRFL